MQSFCSFFKNNVCNGPAAAACVHARPGCGDGTLTVTARAGQVGYFHGYLDGVDYVFVDHPCFHGRQDNIYGGDRQEARAAPAPACRLCSRSPSSCPARARRTQTAACTEAPAWRARSKRAPGRCALFPRRAARAAQIMFRCALLSKAALEAPWHVPCGGAPYGDSNLAFIANDWHTALLPLYLQVRPRASVSLRIG